MKLFIYNVETREIVAIVNGETNEECEEKGFNYLGADEYAGTYTPGGLVESGDAEVIE